MVWKIKKLGGSRVEVNESEHIITPELQEDFTNTKGALLENLSIEVSF